MPGIAVAGSDGLGTSSTMVDDKVENRSTIAADGIELVVGGTVGRSGIGGAMPDKAVAGGLHIDADGAIIDGQMESD